MPHHPAVEHLTFRLNALLLANGTQPLQEGGGVQEYIAVGPVHGAGIVGTHLRLQNRQMGKTHILWELGAGGRGVDHCVHVGLGQRLANQVDHMAKPLGLHGILSLVVPHVDMDHGCACLGAGHRVGGDLLRGDGHVRSLGFCCTRAAEGRGDDQLLTLHLMISSLK